MGEIHDKIEKVLQYEKLGGPKGPRFIGLEKGT